MYNYEIFDGLESAVLSMSSTTLLPALSPLAWRGERKSGKQRRTWHSKGLYQ